MVPRDDAHCGTSEWPHFCWRYCGEVGKWCWTQPMVYCEKDGNCDSTAPCSSACNTGNKPPPFGVGNHRILEKLLAAWTSRCCTPLTLHTPFFFCLLFFSDFSEYVFFCHKRLVLYLLITISWLLCIFLLRWPLFCSFRVCMRLLYSKFASITTRYLVLCARRCQKVENQCDIPLSNPDFTHSSGLAGLLTIYFLSALRPIISVAPTTVLFRSISHRCDAWPTWRNFGFVIWFPWPWHTKYFVKILGGRAHIYRRKIGWKSQP